jgi:Leucine-rich repeat (LRR) protein
VISENLVYDTGFQLDVSLVQGMLNLKRFVGSNSRIASVVGFKDHPNLEELNLNSNDVSSLSNLGTLPKLKKLILSLNLVGSSAGLENLPALEELSLDQQGAAAASLTLSSIRDLKNLRLLDVAGNQGINIDGIQNVTTLEFVDAHLCGLTTSSPFTNLKNLVDLDLSQNDLTEVDGLAGLTKLNYLRLMYIDKTVNILGLATNANAGGLGSGDTLYLNGTAVTDCAHVATLTSAGVGIYSGKNCY